MKGVSANIHASCVRLGRAGRAFGAAPSAAFSGGGMNLMVTPLINNMLTANTAAGKYVATAPTAASVTTEINLSSRDKTVWV